MLPAVAGKRPSRKGKGKVIPLSRWRAALGRASLSSRMQALLDTAHPERLVPTLPVQDIYYAIQEVGLAESEELLALCSPIQIRGFFDLDMWSRDRVMPERFQAWMGALVGLGFERLGVTVAALDPELPSLYLTQRARIYDLTLNEAPPEDTTRPILYTPDTFFALELMETGDAARQTEQFVMDLYRADIDLGRRVVMGAHWELPSELEESSYRFRSGRMADLGFADYYEALEIYRFLDPKSVRIGEGTSELQRDPEREPSSLPAPYLKPLGRDGFFQRAAASLGSDRELGNIEQSFVSLSNRVVAAENVDLGTPEALHATVDRTVGFLSIGLEVLAHADLTEAAMALRTVSLVRIFRVGVSLAMQLGKLARALRKRAPGRFEPETERFLSGLEHRPPMFGLPGSPLQPFAEVSQLRAAAAELEHLGYALTLVLDRFGFASYPGPLGDLVRTAAANLALGRDFSPEPLEGGADLDRLRKQALSGPGRLRPEFRVASEHAIRERAGTQAPPYLATLVDSWLDRIEHDLGPLKGPLDPRFIGGFIVRIPRIGDVS